MEIDLDSSIFAEISTSLRRYDRISVVTLIAGLLTVPEFHRFTLRLEILAHLATRDCNGKKKPSLRAVEHWLNKLLPKTGVTVLEDPPSDVFVGNVMSPFGNHLIHQGLWSGNDLWLQDLVDALLGCGNSCSSVLESVLSLLRLSSEMLHRAGLRRWQAAPKKLPSALQLQGRHRVLERSRFCVFTRRDLEALKIPRSDLSPFILPDDWQDDEVTPDLERWPLIQVGDDLFLALPSGAGIAMRRFSLSHLSERGSLEAFQLVLRRQQAQRDHSETALLGIAFGRSEIPRLPPRPPRLPAIDLHVAKADDDKFCLVVIIHDDLAEIIEHGFDSFIRFSTTAEESLPQFIRECVFSLDAISYCRGGLLLCVYGGLGRGFLHAEISLPRGWTETAIGLTDYRLLAGAKGLSLLRLWKLHAQMDVLAEQGLDISPANGELDRYAYCSEQELRLLPPSFPYGLEGGQLNIDPAYGARFRRQLRADRDEHCALLYDDRLLPVHRYHSQSIWARTSNVAVYASPDMARRSGFYGVAETSAGNTWVIHEQIHGSPDDHDFAYRIWDALLFWLHPLLCDMENRLPYKRHPPLRIFLVIDGIIDAEDLTQVHPDAQPAVSIDREQAAATLLLDRTFLPLFSRAENIAERRILESVASALVGLYPASPPLDVVSIVRDLMGGTNARMVHTFRVYDADEQLAAIDPREYRTIQEEDSSVAWLGLAGRVGSPSNEGTIHGSDRCNEFLHSVVDALWKGIHDDLVQLDRYSVIQRAYGNVEALTQEQYRWRISARALTALHGDTENVAAIADREDQKLSAASIASRILVEMAVCTAPATDGRAVALSDFDRVLAQTDTLLWVASLSEILYDGLAEAKIQVSPNGEFRLAKNHMQEVQAAYRASIFEDDFRTAERDYEQNFVDRVLNHTRPSPSSFEVDFAEAFRIEYGIAPHRLLLGVRELYAIGFDQARSLVTVSTKELRHRLRDKAGLTGPEVDAFLTQFALCPRDRWDVAPKGFRNRDWEPWRFKRRLSLAYRPLVRLGFEDEAFVVYGAGALKRALGWLLVRIRAGEMPQEFFRSAEMRSYVASRVDQLGHDFNLAIAEILQNHGWMCSTEVQMSTMGAPARFGDLDVVAVRDGDNRVLLIEGKRLQPIRNANEIGNLCREFKGEGRDKLDKALQRWEWIRQNQSALLRKLELPDQNRRLIEMLVTSADVPLRYMPDLPLSPEMIVPLVQLPSRLGH